MKVQTKRRARDVVLALTYACTVRAHEMVFGHHPDLPTLERGTSWEPRLVSRHQELVEMFSRLLLVRLRARVDRLASLEAECLRRATEATLPGAVLAAGRHALTCRHPAVVLRAVLWVLSPIRRREFRRTHVLAAKLAAMARTTVIEAGAAHDPVVRTRLLAATRYQATRDALDFTLGDPSLAGPPDRLLAELDWLDTHLPPREGRS
ncbi:hypothetical protein [Spongiactinospora sp. TRM90649]|uniref:hypothetical protein n=1 Tax=Spongiactinospora sp. TRM90649 TaxID=3031114 RepID=UPI0023F9E134|nr:hypothetical protein [Spongiactinospora sp. TRM90649]MDF5756048.1 hypothetical protein [Spongiactinospora sp. TRM90649]